MHGEAKMRYPLPLRKGEETLASDLPIYRNLMADLVPEPEFSHEPSGRVYLLVQPIDWQKVPVEFLDKLTGFTFLGDDSNQVNRVKAIGRAVNPFRMIGSSDTTQGQGRSHIFYSHKMSDSVDFLEYPIMFNL